MNLDNNNIIMESNNWDCKPIKDLAKVYIGKTPPRKEPEWFSKENGMKWVSIKDLGNCGLYIKNTSEYLTHDAVSKFNVRIAPKGTVLLSFKLTVGRVAITSEDMVTNEAIAQFLIKDYSVLSRLYLYYYLKQFNYNSLGSTSSIAKAINSKIVREIPIVLPPIEIQNKISKILYEIDSRIENLHNINTNLFNILHSLQKEWMVDFTPFKSEQFKPSSFGLIPERWNVGKLGDVIELFDSKRVPLSGKDRENMEKIYPYYGAASLMDYVDDYIFDGTYLLIGEDGTVIDDKGYPILQYVWGKFWVNNHAHIAKGKNGFTVDSLYLLLSKTNVQSIVTGAVQAKINQNNLKSIEIIIPPSEVMEKFNEIISPFFKTIRANHDEIKKLQTIRDTLLPKLISGELDVSMVSD